MLEELISLLIGLGAGVLAGMFGIGGGVVIVPALILFLGFSMPQASASSLAALMLPVSIFAVIQYHKAKLISYKSATIVAIGILSGVYSGTKIALGLDPNMLKGFYGIFLFYVFYNFSGMKLFKTKKADNDQKNISKQNNNSWFFLFLLGILAGILSGMFGIGGGLIIIPFLITIMKFDTKMAIGTSLTALLLPVGLPGVIEYANRGLLNIPVAATIALGLVFGSIVGAKITIKNDTKKVKKMYGIFVLIIGLYFAGQWLMSAL